jgi:hypothetical protein
MENYLENFFGFGWLKTQQILKQWFLENYGIEVHKIY